MERLILLTRHDPCHPGGPKQEATPSAVKADGTRLDKGMPHL